MGWENIGLKDVNPNFELIGAGDYEFQILPGAKINDYNSLDFPVTVASEGDFKGRRLFVQLPDPAEQPWVTKQLKRIEQAVGLEKDDDVESVVQWMNRLGENFAKFGCPLVHRTYKTKQGDDRAVEQLKLDKARPAA